MENISNNKNEEEISEIDNKKEENFQKFNLENDSGESHLEFIEKSIQQEIVKDKNFTQKIFLKILKSEGKEKVLEIISKRLEEKKILFLRHAEAEHNEYNRLYKSKGVPKPNLFDPKLTELGLTQCEEIKNMLKNLDFKIEVVFTSPLRRTLETTHHIKEGIFHHHKSGSKVNFIVTELLREIVINPNSHFGHDLNSMKTKFGEMDFLNYEFINKQKWWSYDKEGNEESSLYSHNQNYDSKDIHANKNNFKPEKDSHFRTRIAMFFLWFIFRNEKNALVVSHSKVFKALYLDNTNEKVKLAKNGCYYLLDKEVIYKFINNYINQIIKKKFKNEKEEKKIQEVPSHHKIHHAHYHNPEYHVKYSD